VVFVVGAVRQHVEQPWAARLRELRGTQQRAVEAERGEWAARGGYAGMHRSPGSSPDLRRQPGSAGAGGDSGVSGASGGSGASDGSGASGGSGAGAQPVGELPHATGLPPSHMTEAVAHAVREAGRAGGVLPVLLAAESAALPALRAIEVRLLQLQLEDLRGRAPEGAARGTGGAAGASGASGASGDGGAGSVGGGGGSGSSGAGVYLSVREALPPPLLLELLQSPDCLAAVSLPLVGALLAAAAELPFVGVAESFEALDFADFVGASVDPATVEQAAPGAGVGAAAAGAAAAGGGRLGRVAGSTMLLPDAASFTPAALWGCVRALLPTRQCGGGDGGDGGVGGDGGGGDGSGSGGDGDGLALLSLSPSTAWLGAVQKLNYALRRVHSGYSTALAGVLS
jgi:hypothetical protein